MNNRIEIAHEFAKAIKFEKAHDWVNYPKGVIDVMKKHGYNINREYVCCAVANMQNGQILYGTTTGALIINPDSLKELDYVARLNLMGLEKDGEIYQEYRNRTFYLNCSNIRVCDCITIQPYNGTDLYCCIFCHSIY